MTLSKVMKRFHLGFFPAVKFCVAECEAKSKAAAGIRSCCTSKPLGGSLYQSICLAGSCNVCVI